MDALPITGVDDLDSHLDTLLSSSAPAAPLNPALFDAVTLQVTAASVPALAPRLLPKIVAVLRRLPQVVVQPPRDADIQRAAAVLAELATKLLGPVGFADALALATPAGLADALGDDAAPATNILAMTVVHKAAADPTETAQLASPALEGLLVALVTRWLAAPDVGVGEKGGRVVGDLLEADVPATAGSSSRSRPTVNGNSVNGVTPAPSSGGGSGRLWQRLFRDATLYDNLLKPICQGHHPAVLPEDDADGQPTDEPSRQTTLAQGRILRLVPRLAALNLPAIEDGLLPFVSLHMVVPVDRDMLMHLSVIDYFETLVSVLRVAAAGQASPQHTIDTLRGLLREATAGDAELLQQLRTLPDRTVPEEADALRSWLGQVLPATAPGTRVSGWT